MILAYGIRLFLDHQPRYGQVSRTEGNLAVAWSKVYGIIPSINGTS